LRSNALSTKKKVNEVIHGTSAMATRINATELIDGVLVKSRSRRKALCHMFEEPCVIKSAFYFLIMTPYNSIITYCFEVLTFALLNCISFASTMTCCPASETSS
jgi:hypothetical protein